MPLLRGPHAHHRDLLARAAAKEPRDTGPAKDQDRHLMMTTPLSNTCNRLHHLYRLLADSADARVASSDWCGIRTKTRKISSCKTPAARSRSPIMPIPRGQMGLAAAPFLHP